MCAVLVLRSLRSYLSHLLFGILAFRSLFVLQSQNFPKYYSPRKGRTLGAHVRRVWSGRKPVITIDRVDDVFVSRNQFVPIVHFLKVTGFRFSFNSLFYSSQIPHLLPEEQRTV